MEETKGRAFVLNREGLEVFEIGTGLSGIRSLLASLTRALGPNRPEVESNDVLVSLYEALIAPMSKSFRAGTHLIIVPGEHLNDVPFSALRDSVRKRYLVQDHAIAIAPSAALFAHAVGRDRTIEQSEAPRVFAVGNPRFDAETFRTLKDLKGAESEAWEIAELYPRHQLLLNGDATKRRVLAEAQKSSVAHVASHTVSFASSEGPEAFLLLAPDGEGDSGQLFASDLLRTNFGSTRLIFLSSCTSAGGGSINAQGVAMLVRGLLGAGVPAVVGTLWPVDDRTTPPLATAFHRNFRNGIEAAEALRQAQIGLLEGPNEALRSIRHWGGFEVIGTARLTSPHSTRRSNP